MTKERLTDYFEQLKTDATRLKNYTYTHTYKTLTTAEKYLITEQYKLTMKLLDVVEARLSLC